MEQVTESLGEVIAQQYYLTIYKMKDGSSKVRASDLANAFHSHSTTLWDKVRKCEDLERGVDYGRWKGRDFAGGTFPDTPCRYVDVPAIPLIVLLYDERRYGATEKAYKLIRLALRNTVLIPSETTGESLVISEAH